MRNLRRALSLALASVMVLGLMIVGSNALTADFGDVDQIDPQYTEAIDVLSTIGLFDGMNDDANSFEPLGTLTRAQAAKLLTVMRLGVNTAESLDKNTQIFADVPKGHWAAGFIAYCHSVGILAGNGDGTFNPDGKLTGVQFGKMLLVALGYDADIEGYINSGNAWEINVATDMLESGIDIDDISFSDPITREQAAQMVFNTIKTPMVKYSSNNQREYLATTNAKENTISTERLTNTGINQDGGYMVEFGEKYFPKLTFTPTTDDFDRPSHIWLYNNAEIDTYIDYDKLQAEYTTPISGRTLYELLSRETINRSKTSYYIDGKSDNSIAPSNMIRENTANYNSTGNGVLTQVFYDADNAEITITSINTYLAKADDDYNSEKQSLDITVHDSQHDDDNGITKVSLEDFPFIGKYKEKDKFLVRVSYVNTVGSNDQYKVSEMYDAEKLPNVTLNRYAVDNYVVTGNDQYYYAEKGFNEGLSQLDDVDDFGSESLTAHNYDLYLDMYGYLIGNVALGSTDYLFLVGYDKPNSVLANTYATGSAIFLDGTMKNIPINTKDTNRNILKYDDGPNALIDYLEITNTSTGDGHDAQYNRWFTYTEEDGVYTLDPVEAWMEVESTAGTNALRIRSFDVRLDKKIGNNTSTDPKAQSSNRYSYANENTVFIAAETDKVSGNLTSITKVNGTYTSVQTVDLEPTTKDKTNILMQYQPMKYDPSDPSKFVNTGSKITPSVFVVYDPVDLYIIGAVVIGDEVGNKDYGNVLSSTDEEWIDSDTGDHCWRIKAVVDGEITNLILKPDTLTDYNILKNDIRSNLAETPSASNSYKGAKNGLYKFTYDKDNKYIVNAVQVQDADNKVFGNDDWIGINGTYGLNMAVNPDNYNVYTVNYKYDEAFLTEKNGTLYSQVKNNYSGNYTEVFDKGLTLAANAPVIVVQTEDYTDPDTRDRVVYNSFSSIEKALEVVAGKDKFTGWISAVINSKGNAEYIVISDNEPRVIGNSSSTQSGSASIETFAISKDSSSNALKATAIFKTATTYAGHAVIDFYFVDANGKVYTKDTQSIPFVVGTPSINTISSALNQNGDYYAVITVYNADGVKVTEAQTEHGAFAF